MLLLARPAACWQEVRKGFEYQAAGPRHFFRIDPEKYQMEIALAQDLGAASLSTREFREKSGALLVINGGFFDEKNRPLGLRVRHGRTIHPLRKADWGIFQVKEGVPSILHKSLWNPGGVEMAIQVGPRLVIDGRIPTFKPESEPHRRSALGITRDGKILVALSDEPIPIRKWAEILREQASSAINLDGGGSTQLSVELKNFSLNLSGLTAVPDALAVFLK